MTPQERAAQDKAVEVARTFRCLGARCDHATLADCQEAFAAALTAWTHRPAPVEHVIDGTADAGANAMPVSSPATPAAQEVARTLEAVLRAVPWREVPADDAGVSHRVPDYPAMAAALIAWGQPKTLGDAVKVAREKWYADHGGRDTVQELYHRLEQDNESLRAEVARLTAQHNEARQELADVASGKAVCLCGRDGKLSSAGCPLHGTTARERARLTVQLDEMTRRRRWTGVVAAETHKLQATIRMLNAQVETLKETLAEFGLTAQREGGK